MTITQDMHQLVAELHENKSASSEFVPSLILQLGRAYMNSCYDLAEIDISKEKVAARWTDAATGLTELLEAFQKSFPDSSHLRALWTLQKEALEMSNFYNKVPDLA